MAHTPGPWSIVPALNGNLIQGADGSRVVRGQGGIKSWGDARLIAATPDLLKQLAAALHALRSYEYGNASPNLAGELADAIEQTIANAAGK